ncbi:MAG TPA: winged helix DNA-binding protein [Alphaproteobacteria bacterium]|nr:winged helix DNA-binding protein [Alphaproteobacteria bacterium]
MTGTKRRIVSSAHLVSDRAAELSEYEFGVIVASNAFNRWIVRCMTAAGVPDLSPMDVLVLHGVNHRGRGKRLTDLCLVYGVEDQHLVSYSLKKLLRLKLVARTRQGKEALFAATEEGRAVCARYREVREDCLVEGLSALGQLDPADLAATARLLRALSGVYDQAARSATVL